MFCLLFIGQNCTRCLKKKSSEPWVLLFFSCLRLEIRWTLEFIPWQECRKDTDNPKTNRCIMGDTEGDSKTSWSSSFELIHALMGIPRWH